ncbi:aminoglycoside phosphotransferase family protein [Patescibacteria group bacterium]|nr:aminoglycoside phosphotransferase family protein [Patescibacteria group bacterium]
MKRRALSEKSKAKIARLVDHDFVEGIFRQHLPKYYPDFKTMLSISSDPYKRHLGVTSAVFVVEFKIKYLDKHGKTKNLDIFASAHSDGSRKGAYQKTKALYKHGFDKGQFRVTKPLFFLSEQKAFFYESSPGRSFFYFFTENPKADLSHSLKLIAGWAKKLHQTEFKANFKWPIFDIYDMVPSPNHFVGDFLLTDKRQGKLVDKLVKDMAKTKKAYDKTIKKTIIYGDYHPENVVIKSLEAKDLEMIDFTDIALGDPMMDLGTFLQQLDFMGHNFLSRKEMNEYKKYFVESYFEQDFEQIDIQFINRINLYQSWTALRTAVFLFYMKDIENPIDDLLEDSINHLKLARENNRNINLYHHG